METSNTIKIEKDGKEIILIGTAHVLEESRLEVENLIDEVNPDTVCVELDQARYSSIMNQEKWKNLDIIKVIREGNGFLLFANMILTAFQRKIGMDMKSMPGEEMISAIKKAKEKNVDIVLCDRDVNVTMRRAWALSSFGGKLHILELLLDSIFFGEEIKKEDLDEMMKGENLFNEMIAVFSEKLPKVKTVFIDERDIFITDKILNAKGKKIIVVIGKGHMQGIINMINTGYTYDKNIEIVPPPSIISKLLPWILTAIIVGIFVYGFFVGGADKVLNMLWQWILITGTSTAIATLLILAHPVTIISSWIVAPITTLNPTIGAGFFLAFIEAFFKKPQVKDLENLPNDILTVRGFFKNRVTKILIVFIASSIGASIGTFVGIPLITSLLGK
jgi:pheromone shutdown-related protein TraB